MSKLVNMTRIYSSKVLIKGRKIKSAANSRSQGFFLFILCLYGLKVNSGFSVSASTRNHVQKAEAGFIGTITFAYIWYINTYDASHEF
jgi:hypothetical protein